MYVCIYVRVIILSGRRHPVYVYMLVLYCGPPPPPVHFRTTCIFTFVSLYATMTQNVDVITNNNNNDSKCYQDVVSTGCNS